MQETFGKTLYWMHYLNTSRLIFEKEANFFGVILFIQGESAQIAQAYFWMPKSTAGSIF